MVIPTLLLSRPGVELLLERLEIHCLGNRDPHIGFALLTDFPDSASPVPSDDPLLELCASRIRRLNRKYAATGRAPFYLFHRRQEWNAGQGKWMGRERKRGKIEDFNRMITGAAFHADAFDVKVGDLKILASGRYVITLDTDTQLPPDSAWKLVGTLAHPLHTAAIDPRSGIVREGYAILQPRVSISMESANRSRFAQIFSGQTGLDPYTSAISEVYQDLLGQATFTGKGIYDVHAFCRILDGRFPDNTLLSHDLIEGEYARTGLATDVEVIEEYPSSYGAHRMRKHRWIRGDWQILQWLLPRVPNAEGGRSPNPLSFISRWKIADNLRPQPVRDRSAADRLRELDSDACRGPASHAHRGRDSRRLHLCGFPGNFVSTPGAEILAATFSRTHRRALARSQGGAPDPGDAAGPGAGDGGRDREDVRRRYRRLRRGSSPRWIAATWPPL